MNTRGDVSLAFCAANGHEFVGAVGAGAFKETFQIVPATGEPQALRVYEPDSSPERTSGELSAMQRYSHPNIGRLTSIDGFYDDGVQYLLSVEEFLSGGTLTAKLKTGP